MQCGLISEHVFIPEINPHCILSQIYALFIEFYYALFFFLFLFFKDMHYNTNPFSTVSCFRRFVSSDKISHYFDRFIRQRLYYDAEIA
jgi:hypothetical protein